MGPNQLGLPALTAANPQMVLLAFCLRIEQKASESESKQVAVSKAQEEEKRRVARELHDDLTQRLEVLAFDASHVLHRCGEAYRLIPVCRVALTSCI